MRNSLLRNLKAREASEILICDLLFQLGVMLRWQTFAACCNQNYFTLKPNFGKGAVAITRSYSSFHSPNPFISSKLAMPAHDSFCSAVIRNELSTSAALLMPSPSKKKTKSDPMVERMREERKKKKLSKALKKLDKKPRIPKPLHEMEIDPSIYGDDMEIKRARTLPSLSDSELEEKNDKHALLMKEWSRFAGRRHVSEIRQIDRVLMHRQIALEELRKESNVLYAQAIKPETGTLEDSTRIFYQASGPTSTPPIRKTLDDTYEDWLIDGHYEEVTKKFSVQYGDEKAQKSYLTSILNTYNKNHAKKKKKQEEEEK